MEPILNSKINLNRNNYDRMNKAGIKRVDSRDKVTPELQSQGIKLEKNAESLVNLPNIGHSDTLTDLPTHSYRFFPLDSTTTDMTNSMVQCAASFFQGNISSEQLKDAFRASFEQISAYYIGKGVTSGSDTTDNQQMLKDTYVEFRKSVMTAALNHNSAETSLQHQIPVGQRSWLSYDSDVYYYAEDAKQVLNAMAAELSKEYELGEFEIPASKDVRSIINNYDSFNSAWNGRYGNTLGKMINTELVPPKGFSFYYEFDLYQHQFEISYGGNKIQLSLNRDPFTRATQLKTGESGDMENGQFIIGGKGVDALEGFFIIKPAV